MSAPGNAVLVLSLMAVILVAGCFTADAYTTVDEKGQISEYRLEFTTSQMVYNLIKESAKDEGYASVKEMVEAEGLEAEGVEFGYNERWDTENDEVALIFEAKGPIAPDQIKGLSVTKTNDGFLVYRQTLGEGEAATREENPFAESMNAAVSLNYYLKMPGEIVDGNANVVEGNRAEWHLSGSDMESSELYAKSELPALSMNGFGLLLCVTALLLAFLWHRH
jgi:hypothetical protein